MESLDPLPSAEPAGQRLQKVLAAAGVASRRKAEELIAAGRVSVDGQVVVRQGARVDAARSDIRVDGVPVLSPGSTRTYLALNKPRGLLTTMSDDRGRACVGDLVADRGDRLYHVGRLDADSEGLLLLTNDGELAHRLMHPRYRVGKRYLAEVEGHPGRTVLRTLRAGVSVDGHVVQVSDLTVSEAVGARCQVRLVIYEGSKHVVRRLLAEVGHPVRRLVREAVGPVTLGHLRPGAVRHLTAHELAALYQLVDL